jgi:Flp pilus assembly protein TadB
VRLPKDISPGAASRRRLLADALAAIALAAVGLILSAGVGVAGAIALVIIALLIPWYAIEAVLRRRGRRRRAPVLPRAGGRRPRPDTRP